MKRYKLIKKYPGLPEDWEVGMIVHRREFEHLYHPVAQSYNRNGIGLREHVENNPEFWEEVVPKVIKLKVN